MSGYGPPRGWRGSNAWGTASPQRTEEPMSETERAEVVEARVQYLDEEALRLQRTIDEARKQRDDWHDEATRQRTRAEKAEAAVTTLHAVIENMHKHDREQREGRRQAETALARLRAQLGESCIEWGVQHPLYGTDYIQGADNARAQCYQLNADDTNRPWRVVTRLAGQWRGENEPDATRLERYDDAPRTALECAADEQGEREGHGPNALGGRCRNDTSGNSRA